MLKCNYRRVGNRILGHGSSHVKTNSGGKCSASGAISSLWALIMSLASFACALIKGWVTRMEQEEKMDIREELSREVSGLAAVGELGEVRQRLDKVHTLLARLNKSGSRSQSPLGSPHDGHRPPWPSSRPLPSSPQDQQLAQSGQILIGAGRTFTPRGPPSTPRTTRGDETLAFVTHTTALGDAMTQPDAPATPTVTPRPRWQARGAKAWARGDDGQGHDRQPLSVGHSPANGSRNHWDVHESARTRVLSAGSDRGEEGQQQRRRQGKGGSAQQCSRALTPPCSVASPAEWSRLAPSSSPLSDLGGACNSRPGQWSGERNKAMSMTPRGRHRDGGACAALFSGARHNRLEVVQDILGQWTHLVDARDEHGNTCLMLACQNGNKRIVKATLRKGGDINAVNRRGFSALDFCNMFGYVKLAAYLVEKGAVSGSADQQFASDAGDDAIFDPPPRVLTFEGLVHEGGGKGVSWDEESVEGDSSASTASTCRSRLSALSALAPVLAEKVPGCTPFALLQGSCA